MTTPRTEAGIEKYLYDLGGNPSEAVQRRRRERLYALLDEAARKERERIVRAIEERMVGGVWLDEAAVLAAITDTGEEAAP